MKTIDQMIIALHLAKKWVPCTAHGLIVQSRIQKAINAYDSINSQSDQKFPNRLMR